MRTWERGPGEIRTDFLLPPGQVVATVPLISDCHRIPEPSVLPRGFRRVAGLAERLPVCRVPEKRLVSMVRNDVVDFCCRHQLATLLMHDAQRVRPQIGIPCLSPAIRVTTFSTRTTSSIDLLITRFAMRSTEATPITNQLAAAWLAAWLRSGYRHKHLRK